MPEEPRGIVPEIPNEVTLMEVQPVDWFHRCKLIRISLSANGKIQYAAFLLLVCIGMVAVGDVRGEQIQSDNLGEVANQRVSSRFQITKAAVTGTRKIHARSSSMVASATGLSLSASLPAGTVGTAYSGHISAISGVAPYSFSVSAGALPQGLFLDSSTGAIAGTPTVVATKTFWVRASDSVGNTAKLHLQITIGSASALSTNSISVAISPTGVSVASGATQQFTAMVQGTSNTAVNWSASAGNVSSMGLFTAPVVSSSTGVNVTAKSAADPTQNATVVVTVTAPAPTPKISVSVSPSTTSVASGGTQQFTASVQGTSNTGVSWSASAGTISGGTFVAPIVASNTVINVTATSVADTSAIASGTVTVMAAAPAPTPAPTPSSNSGTLCGTDSNGVPTDNSQCGASGTNPYSTENATDLTSWCGGSVPGICTPINSCNPTLTAGTSDSHSKYYLASDLNCGASSLAMMPQKYVDVNLNGHTITGSVFHNGSLRGFHFFNGRLNCTLTSPLPDQVATGQYAFGCLDAENNGGTYVTSANGGDQVRIHHISGTNGNTRAWYMRFTGKVTGPAGGWTEPIVQVYNNTFQSMPESTSNRQHAGVYSETAPVEYYNNRGDVGSNGQANAAQLLEIYGNGGQDPFPNYIHNNYLTCEPFSVTNGDSCRPILCDGQHYCHLQYNDIWSTNNRCMRLRDALNAEVDHNYCHQLVAANGFKGTGIHSGDPDVGSGIGQSLSQNIHDNTFELGASTIGLRGNGQQGITLQSNTFLCAAAGCSGATTVTIGNTNQSFSGGVTVSAANKTFTCSGCSFTTGTSVKARSVIAFSGFANAANNNIFTVASNTGTVITVSDPANLLVNETCSSGCQYNGVSQANLYNPTLGTGLLPAVTVSAVSGQPTSTTLDYCGTATPSVAGSGTFNFVTGTCP